MEGLGEVEEAPADDDIVVESHEETHLQDAQELRPVRLSLFDRGPLKATIHRHLPTHHTAGKADAAQSRADVVPHADAAAADALAHGQLQEEERDADQDQQDEVGHQVRTCRREGRQIGLKKTKTKKKTHRSNTLNKINRTRGLAQLPEKVASAAFILAATFAVLSHQEVAPTMWFVQLELGSEREASSKSAGPGANTAKKFLPFFFSHFAREN